MTDNVLTLARRNIRSTDSNSLLRLYDQAKALCTHSPSPKVRAKADKAIQSIGAELRKREVRL